MNEEEVKEEEKEVKEEEDGLKWFWILCQLWNWFQRREKLFSLSLPPSLSSVCQKLFLVRDSSAPPAPPQLLLLHVQLFLQLDASTQTRQSKRWKSRADVLQKTRRRRSAEVELVGVAQMHQLAAGPSCCSHALPCFFFPFAM